MADPPVPPPDLAAELKANLQAAIDRVERTAAAVQAKAVENAVAAERELCAQLAEQYDAIGSKCPKGIAPNPSAECGCRACRPRFSFAALLRKDHP